MANDTHKLQKVYQKLGYQFKNENLILQALTHSSATNDRPIQSYERMEFLGDRVLGLVTATMLYRTYSDADEGDMHRRHNELVRKEACAKIAEKLNLGPHLILGHGETMSGGRRKMAILADVCEAIIAAIYLDGGFDEASDFVKRNWREDMLAAAEPSRDAKSALQEWAQARGLPPPEYETIGRTGPDHLPTFKVRASLPDIEPSIGIGQSKRAAEHEAAERMLMLVDAEAGSA